MSSIISFNVNNQRVLTLSQADHDSPVIAGSSPALTSIPAGDMVMLINFYRYIKNNDFRHDFINPNGKNEEA